MAGACISDTQVWQSCVGARVAAEQENSDVVPCIFPAECDPSLED